MFVFHLWNRRKRRRRRKMCGMTTQERDRERVP